VGCDAQQFLIVCVFGDRHTNEKNFVGLAADGDFIACGSELNSVFVYYKALSKQILAYRFPTAAVC
jgi:hypothetical protein